MKTAVVIGGASGVGRGIALSMALQNINIVIADVDLTSAERVKAEIEAAGHKAVAVKVDATNAESLKSLAEKVIEKFESVHILVSTVGAILEKKLEQASEQDWQWMCEVNLMANVRATQFFLPHLRKNKKSHIVLTGSGGGAVYSTTRNAYWSLFSDETRLNGFC